MSFYSKGKETAYAVFDAHGVTDKNSWFDCSRLLYTAYDDLNRLKAVSYCGIPGYLLYMCLYFIHILLEFYIIVLDPFPECFYFLYYQKCLQSRIWTQNLLGNIKILKLLNSHIKLAKKRHEIPFANKNYPTTHATLNISESARDLWSLFLHSD